MLDYYLNFDDLPTGASANTYTTLATLLAADTAGYRFALMGFNVGPSDDAPADLNVNVAIKRVADVSAGGAGSGGTAVAGSAMCKQDTDARDAVISGRLGPSSEPTTYETRAILEMDFNLRGGFAKEWDFESAPRFNRDQLCGLLAAPRTAAAARLSGTLHFREY